MKRQVGCFVQLGEELFGGTPRCRGYGAECFKAGEEFCVEGLDVRTKGEDLVKSNAEELGSGVECKGVPVRVSWC